MEWFYPGYDKFGWQAVMNCNTKFEFLKNFSESVDLFIILSSQKELSSKAINYGNKYCMNNASN